MIYARLFYVFAKLGFFTYGGGYAIIALLLGILKEYNWITDSEFSNLVAISQITPGPIAINAATFVGYKVAGVLGSAVATFGIFIPAFIITMIVSKFFYAVKNNEQFNNIMNALRVCAVALIASAVVTFTKDAFFVKLTETSILRNIDFIQSIFKYVSPIGIFIFALSIFLKIKKVPILAIILISAVLGIILY
ncbi:chromate transporter [Brachyspira hyodysenteriae]|uniref:Chromate transport protein n=1 Tax=Brachyspira hyodysenteriae (strain ATCC 49526 / WA1) TaxID=565034 RepID=A0A3B6VBX2_BRAHW|nr:chromate transporter [Brachyspira hyodysenteriae]ACN84177.1 chromate transport protein [Brachyspira hyodysenteriae WA1]AUJ49906.1 chromate transporter [Brachyspira hyodysenteriae]KLI22533.1 chromate transporter [Brachyspira hyodysenteriae]KLI34436.1 chromate transporter [Brachyspira hyodysenteriae]KLI36136.1 chromate transporter [Brachyspira hyodysenteriae]